MCVCAAQLTTFDHCSISLTYLVIILFVLSDIYILSHLANTDLSSHSLLDLELRTSVVRMFGW